MSNSSPLIWLAKIGRLGFLRTLFGEVVVPRLVYEESASQRRSPDAVLIGKAVEEWWMRVSEEAIEGTEILADASGIHLGEAEAILLAKRLRADRARTLLS